DHQHPGGADRVAFGHDHPPHRDRHLQRIGAVEHIGAQVARFVLVADAEARAVDDAGIAHATTTGILPMRACHSRGPVWCTEVPCESTATVTGMSLTSNS